MNKKIVLGVVGIAVVIGLIFVGVGKKGEPATMSLGFMLPLTGPLGAIGEGIKNAGLMAVEDYKAANPGALVDVVIEDDGFDVKKGIPAYTKLTTLDKVDGIMMISTPIIDAIHTKMNADGLPIVSIGLQNDGVGPDNIFQTTLAPIAPIEALAEYVTAGNHKKVAVVYSSTLAATKNFYDAFVKNYTKDHTDFVVTDAQSAKTVAAKIMTSGVDAVVVLEDAVGGPLATKELKALDTKNTLAYYYDFQLGTGWAEYIKLVGDANKLNGAHSLKIAGGNTTEFAKNYKAKYGVDPAPYAEYGYDSTMVLLSGYDKDAKAWSANIQKTSFTGPSGKLTFDQNGVRIQDVTLITVKNGALE